MSSPSTVATSDPLRRARVRLEAEEGERYDEQDHEDLYEALVLLNQCKHDVGFCESKKGEPKFALLAKSGGVDGTRTRDPRRDRPVF